MADAVVEVDPVDEAGFVAAHRSRWERLETLVKRAHSHRKLSGDEVLEMAALYRACTSDLSVARRDFPSSRTTAYLNTLVGLAHSAVYAGAPRPGGNRLLQYIESGFPRAFRRAGKYIALSWVIFLGAAAVSWLLVAIHPRTALVLMPDAVSLEDVMRHHQLWMRSATANHSVAANFIMLNNIQVAFIAFAGGMLAGILTFWVLAQNGISLGVVGALVAHYKLSLDFWSFVVPHGVIELSVIMIAGGAGLAIGDAILRPGLLSRQDAVVRAARLAAALIMGCVPLLMIAGTIESYFSPSDAPIWLKFVIGACEAFILYGYLLFCGRKPTAVREI